MSILTSDSTGHATSAGSDAAAIVKTRAAFDAQRKAFASDRNPSSRSADAGLRR